MGAKDPLVSAYIARSADFARPILNRLRKLVHAGCPEVEESIKWGAPHFVYGGMLCNMAAFKNHCAFGFSKARLMKSLAENGKSDHASGQYGRMATLADLPPDQTIIEQVQEAARLNAEGVKLPRARPQRKKPLRIPPYFLHALQGNPQAMTTFNDFSPSHKREYVEWISEAKTDETRQKRLETAVSWLTQGKSRNWKYKSG